MTPKSLGNLLLTEDDPGQRKILGGYLRKRGYEVLEAGSADEAIERASEKRPDLLITDLLHVKRFGFMDKGIKPPGIPGSIFGPGPGGYFIYNGRA